MQEFWTALEYSFDFPILNYIQEHFRSDFLDMVMKPITYAGSGPLWIVMALLFMFVFTKYRKSGLTMLVSLIFMLLIVHLALKLSVSRLRPFEVNTEFESIISRPMGTSFPSGHATASMAVTASLFCTKNKWWIPVGILSLLICFSRLYFYVHFPSDVITGMLCGILFGWLSAKIVEKGSPKLEERFGSRFHIE